MKLRLEVFPSANSSYRFEHPGPQVRLGRSPGCDLVLTGENTQVVSGTHALIDLKPDGAFLVDLESANGTYVNESRIDGATRLEAGDRVRLGQTGPWVQVTGIDLPRPPRTERAAASSPRAQGQSGQAVVAALVVLATVMVLALGWQQLRLSRLAARLDRLQADKEAGKKEEPDRTQPVNPVHLVEPAGLFADYNESVFLVRTPVGEGAVRYDTAFVLDAAGTLATNAQVAQLAHVAQGEGHKTEVVGRGARATYPVVEAKWHKDYTGRKNSPDVGTLRVQLPAGAPALKPLPRASDAELQGLQPGAWLCCIGFPMYHEDDYANPARMVARVFTGTYNRPLPGRPTATEFADLYVLEHDLNTWYGAGGSPVFNRQGKVVAVVNVASEPAGKDEQPAPLSRTAIRIDQLNGAMINR